MQSETHLKTDGAPLARTANRIRKIAASVLLLFLFPLLLRAAGPEELRIVSLSPGLTELVWALGLGNRMIARSSVCDWPEQVRSLPVAGDYAKANPEWLAEQKRKNPGLLLITDELYPPETEKVLTALRIPFRNMPCRTIDDYRVWVRYLGSVSGHAEAAEKELARIEGILAEIRSCAGIPKKKKRVLWILGTEPLVAAGPGSLPDTILKETGALNAAEGARAPYFRASAEWLLKADPDVLILLKRHGTDLAAPLEGHPVWGLLRANRTGNVIRDIPEDELFRPGPRLFEGMRKLQRTLYPETVTGTMGK